MKNKIIKNEFKIGDYIESLRTPGLILLVTGINYYDDNKDYPLVEAVIIQPSPHPTEIESEKPYIQGQYATDWYAASFRLFKGTIEVTQ